MNSRKHNAGDRNTFTQIKKKENKPGIKQTDKQRKISQLKEVMTKWHKPLISSVC